MLDLTSPYCAKWEFIGIELGIDPGLLDATKKNCINSGGVEDCLREMITKWLRHDKPKPTRLALNRALESLSGILISLLNNKLTYSMHTCAT